MNQIYTQSTMKSLFHNTIPSINHSSQIKTSSINLHSHHYSQFSTSNDSKFILSRQQKRKLSIKAVLDSAAIDQYLGLNESDTRNPTLSSSFQSSRYRKPNQTVLEAQTRVCTGPTQTKPLTEEQAFKVFDTILRSAFKQTRKPNQTVLEAQTKICTGPTKIKPLTEEQVFKVLDSILRSGKF